MGYQNVIGQSNNPAHSGIYGFAFGSQIDIDHYSAFVHGVGIRLHGDSVGGANYSAAFGRNHDLDLVGGFVGGLGLIGQGVGAFILGQANVDFNYNTNIPNEAGKLIGVIGNGTLIAGTLVADVRSNHSEFYYDGEFVLPSCTPAMIDAWPNGFIVPTRQWVQDNFVTQSVGAGTGSLFDLNNPLSILYNMDSGDTHNFLTYTFQNVVRGGRATGWINSSTEPDVTGATKEGGFPFVPNADMYITIWSPDGTYVAYFFTPKALLESVNNQEEWTANTNRNLVREDEGKLIFFAVPANGRQFIIDDELPEAGSVEFINASTFNLTINDGTGVGVYPDGNILVPGAACVITKRGTLNEYWVKGELE